MAETTAIAWTDATFNPWWGCQKISPGCDHCYAERDAQRFSPERTLWGAGSERRSFGDKHWNAPRRWNDKARREGTRLRVFCASMADVFDKDAPAGARDRLWALIRETPYLDWLVLTKRIGNVKSMLPPDWGSGYANVWLGISVVNQEEADRDIPKLEALPAAIRFLSCEPLLGPVRLIRIGRGFPLVDWVIVGGESGPQARPMQVRWALDLADECAAASVAFFFKQGSQNNWTAFKDFDKVPAALQVRQWPPAGALPAHVQMTFSS
jgi:protein gp37